MDADDSAHTPQRPTCNTDDADNNSDDLEASPVCRPEEVPAPEEPEEKDSVDAEDAGWRALLLPDGGFPDGADMSQFGIQTNFALLQGWVKQPSPCCAAASVAGAVNAIRGLKRGDEAALSHKEVPTARPNTGAHEQWCRCW